MSALDEWLRGLDKDQAIVRSAARWLTVRQPWADLIMAGVKDVENRSRPVPRWAYECPRCHGRRESWRGTVPAESPSLGYTPCPDCDDNPTEYGSPDSFWTFTLGIHAAKTSLDTDGLQQVMPDGDERLLYIAGIHPRYGCAMGALLGTVDVAGQHHADECARPTDGCTCWSCAGGLGEHQPFCSKWAQPNRWHYELAAPRPLSAPVPWKGRQGWWRL